MNWIKKMKIRTKLLSGFLALALISGVIGYVGITKIHEIDEKDTELYEVIAKPLGELNQLVFDFQQVRVLYRDYVRADDPAEIAKLMEKRKELSKEIAASLTEYEKSIRTESGRKVFDNYTIARKEFVKDLEILEKLALANKDDEAFAYIDSGSLSKTVVKYEETMMIMVNHKIKRGKEIAEGNTVTANAASGLMLTLIIFGALLAVALGFLITMNIQKIIKSVIGQTRQLIDAAVAGKLSTRANAEETNEEFREIVVGMNQVLDAVIIPLNFSADYVERISKGDIPPLITDNYNGDFNTIKVNLNQCINALNGLIEEMNFMSTEHEKGDIDVVVKVEKFQGAYKLMAEGVNLMVGSHISVKKKAMGVFKEFGKGNFDANMEQLPGKKQFINEVIEQVRFNLKGLIEEMNRMSNEHEKGDIDVIINAHKFEGDFKTMAEGVNQMVGSHITVKKKAMGVFMEFGNGNFEAPMDQLPGKKRFINDTIEQVRKNLKALIEDANMLAKAAVEGKLATRADATKHQGDFRKIVEGVNNTLDSVIGPLNVAALYVDKISKGDMPDFITDEYNGDFNNIKNNLNSLIKSFNEIITKAKMVAQGDLTITLAKRSDNDELMGALSEMVSRLSDIVGQVMEAAENVATSSSEMSTSAVQISEGANEQSASAEEVSSSIEEMSSSIQQNSDNSISTEKIAVASAQGMMEVNISAQKSLEAIRQISDKIKIINDIAGKTDILAINAAIEAARAGEQGKGFAVVAAEVRKLAEVSQKAAVEINQLSASSLRVTEESGSLMMKIIPEIQKTAQLVKEIAASSNEQRSGSDQITKAVMQFTQVTQQNAAAAEEMSSSSEELASQAELLKETISFFNTGKKVQSVQSSKNSQKGGTKTKSNVAPRLYTNSGVQSTGVKVNLDSTDNDDKMFENF